jgi:hypothetical protein
MAMAIMENVFYYLVTYLTLSPWSCFLKYVELNINFAANILYKNYNFIRNCIKTITDNSESVLFLVCRNAYNSKQV